MDIQVQEAQQTSTRINTNRPTHQDTYSEILASQRQRENPEGSKRKAM